VVSGVGTGSRKVRFDEGAGATKGLTRRRRR
jgi:hypothetical protein